MHCSECGFCAQVSSKQHMIETLYQPNLPKKKKAERTVVAVWPEHDSRTKATPEDIARGNIRNNTNRHAKLRVTQLETDKRESSPAATPKQVGKIKTIDRQTKKSQMRVIT